MIRIKHHLGVLKTVTFVQLTDLIEGKAFALLNRFDKVLMSLLFDFLFHRYSELLDPFFAHFLLPLAPHLIPINIQILEVLVEII